MEFGANNILLAIGKLQGVVEQAISEMQGHTDRMNRIDQDIEDVRSNSNDKISKLEAKIHELDKKNVVIFTIGSVAGFLINLAIQLFKK